MNPFEELLKELSPLIGLSLHIDENNVCCLWAGETLKVQLEQDKKSHIVVAAFLCELGPGKFREEVLKESLKANAQFFPGGILCFSSKNGQLSIYLLLPIETLDGQKLLESLSILINYALQWQTAIQEGKTAPLSIASKPSFSHAFGLKP